MSRSELLRRLAPLCAVGCVAALFHALEPSFLGQANLRNVLVQTLPVALAAIGMTFVIVSGGIDLSVGSQMALSGVVAALVADSGGGAALAVLAALATGTLAGLVNGALVAGARIVPFVATLGTMGVARGLAKWLAGEQTVVPSPEETAPIEALVTKSLTAPAVLGTLALAVLMALALRRTVFGTWTYALGSNAETARLCGIPVRRLQLAVYGLAGAFAGLAGAVVFARLSVGDPTSSLGAELDVIAAVVIGGASLAGGTGTIPGALAGALLMASLANGCNLVGVPTFVQEMLIGALLVAAVALDRLRTRA
ncbi:MAG: ABC transporter permease [Planctomycetota bacterium]